MVKKISCGLILTDREKFLLGHVTGMKVYSVPKGLIDQGETHIETCCREVKEETGLIINPDDLVDLGIFEYYDEKDLHLFLLITKDLPPIETMYCDSMFTDNFGRQCPEIDGYEYVKFEDKVSYLSKNLLKVMKKVEEKIHLK